MNVQSIMDPVLGDVRHEFDPADEAQVAEAMARFGELVGEKKYLAARRVGAEQLQKVTAFDPADEEVVFAPPMQGG